MYGAQAFESTAIFTHLFENDVEMYGAQAQEKTTRLFILFENDVEMYGAQAIYDIWS